MIYLRKRILIAIISLILSLRLQVYMALFFIYTSEKKNTFIEALKRQRLELTIRKHNLCKQIFNHEKKVQFETPCDVKY